MVTRSILRIAVMSGTIINLHCLKAVDGCIVLFSNTFTADNGQHFVVNVIEARLLHRFHKVDGQYSGLHGAYWT